MKKVLKNASSNPHNDLQVATGYSLDPFMYFKKAQRPDIVSHKAKVFAVQTLMFTISTPCHTSGEL